MTEIHPGPGTPSTVRTADLEGSWYVFKYWHPRLAEDPHASWIRGVQHAYELALSEVHGLEAALREHIEQLHHAESLGGQGNTAWDVIAATVVWSGLAEREQRLADLLELWRVDFEAMRDALEAEAR